jgi:glucose-1-phosphatase
MIQAFLFDIGNVLVRFDHQKALRQLETRSTASPEQIQTAFAALLYPLETGQITTDQFISQAIATTGFNGSSEEFRDLYCDIFWLNEPMWDLVAELHSRYPLYLFSNTSELHLEFLLREFPQFSAFTDGFYSMRVKSMKPDAAIYEAALQQLKLSPEDIFYIDDLPANTAQGNAFGFQTHTYQWQEHAQLLDQLRAGNIIR